MKAIKTLLLLSFSFMSLTTFSFAQNSANAVVLKTTPTNLTSNQDFKIYADTYRFNVDKAEYVWKINGKEFVRGVGIREISLKTGNSGQILNITVSIKTSEGENFTITKIINTGEVNLIWESADGYTPNWYKGKTLNIYGAQIKVVAFTQIIEGNEVLNPSDLVYRWYVNEKIQSNYSGLGKNVLIYQASEEELDRVAVRVEIESKNNDIVYGKEIKIPFVDPEIHIYEKNNSLGVLSNLSLQGTLQFISKEINLIAEPFFFSIKNKNNLAYSWEINDVSAGGAMNAERFIKIPEGRSGTSKIGVKIIEQTKLLQDAYKSFVIKF